MTENIPLRSVEEPAFQKIVVSKAEPMRKGNSPRKTLQGTPQKETTGHCRAVLPKRRSGFGHFSLPIGVSSVFFDKLGERWIGKVIHRRGETARRPVENYV